MRLFIGIPIADSTVRELSQLRANLRAHAGDLRWSAPESWHVTLQFLGNASPEQLDCLTNRLAELRSAPISIQLGAVDVFDRAGVFIVEVQTTPELAALQKRVTAATAHCDFIEEDRPYHPHITLARAKGDGGRRQLRKLKANARTTPAFAPFTAQEFLLYESHTDPGGSRYEVRARFALGKPASQQVSESAN